MSTWTCETTVQMKAFLTAHDWQIDPALPDGNCLFRALSKQMTGDPSKHAELRNILTTFIGMNPHFLEQVGPSQTVHFKNILIKLCRLGSMGVMHKLKLLPHCVKRQYMWPLTQLLWGSAYGQYFLHFLMGSLTSMKFISQSKRRYEIAYTSGCHNDGIVPISTSCSPSPPILPTDKLPQGSITI